MPDLDDYVDVGDDGSEVYTFLEIVYEVLMSELVPCLIRVLCCVLETAEVTDRQTDRETDSQRDRQSERQTDTVRETDRHTVRETDRDRNSQRDRDKQSERQTDKERKRQTVRETDRQSERQTDTRRWSACVIKMWHFLDAALLNRTVAQHRKKLQHLCFVCQPN